MNNKHQKTTPESLRTFVLQFIQRDTRLNVLKHTIPFSRPHFTQCVLSKQCITAFMSNINHPIGRPFQVDARKPTNCTDITCKNRYKLIRNSYFNFSIYSICMVSAVVVSNLPLRVNAEPAFQQVKNSETIQKQVGALQAPMGITAFAGDGIIRLSWEKTEGAVLYKIFTAAEPGVTPENYDKLKQGANFVAFDPHYLITNLNPDTTYYFTVVAENGAGKSHPTPVISATTKKLYDRLVDKPTIPSVPQAVNIQNTSNDLVVSWNPVKGAERYNIYLASESGVGKKSYKKLQNGMAVFNAKNPFIHKGLKKGKQYYVVVSAENQAGESLVSLEVSAMLESAQPKIAKPDAPANLHADINDGQVLLNWKKSSSAKKYSLYYAEQPGISPAKIKKLAGGQVMQNISMPVALNTLLPGKDYYFRVTAQNEKGESRPSPEIKVTIPITDIPEPPPKVQVTQHNDEIILSWLGSPGATSHNVYMASESGNGNGKTDLSELEGAMIYEDVRSPLRLKKLPAATTYYFVITGKNNFGESTTTEEVSIKTKGKLAPPVLAKKTEEQDITVTRLTADTLPDKSTELTIESRLPDLRHSNLYLSLSDNGKPLSDQSLPFSKQPWSCVQSKSTGLVWEIKTNDGGLRDKDNTYTWYNPDRTINGGFSGKPDGGSCNGTPCDTMAYVDAINKSRLCGFNDWRLPTREELTTLIDPKTNAPNPVIDLQSFPFATRSPHWTQTPAQLSTHSAWLISFESGLDRSSNKTQANHVRLVRGYPKPITKVLNFE